MKDCFKVIGNIILLLSVFNCSRENDTLLTTIDIETNVKNMEVVNLGSFTDNIRYITLEYVENLPLRYLEQIEISDNLLLVNDDINCLLYDTEGRLITRIGKSGRGPGEYGIVRTIGLDVDKNQKVYLSTLYDIYEFSINGSFINKYSKSLFINTNIYLSKWFLINDSLFFGHVVNNVGTVEEKALIINKYGQIKYKFKNYIFFDNALGGIGGMEEYAHIYRSMSWCFIKNCTTTPCFI